MHVKRKPEVLELDLVQNNRKLSRRRQLREMESEQELQEERSRVALEAASPTMMAQAPQTSATLANMERKVGPKLQALNRMDTRLMQALQER